jgi:DNA-binding transcriptional LysR family regulator
MSWDDLRIFLAVARTGSVSAAARQLEVQHSTVSRRLQQLEARLGARLVSKKRLGYELTPAGEELRKAAANMEREALAAEGTLHGRDRNLTGSLRVTAVNIMAAAVLAPIFSRFAAAYPEIELQIVVSNSDVSLAERQADVALRVTNDPVETLMGKKIANIASTTYGGREYLAAVRQDGAPPKWIGMTCCGYHRHWTKKLAGGDAHQIVVDDPILTQQMLRQNVALGVLPCYMADPDPLLERYTDPIPEMEMGLWFLFHADLKRTERIHVFRDFLAREIEPVRSLLEGRR